MLLQLIFRLHEEASEVPFDQLSTLISVYYLQFGCIPTCSLGVLISNTFELLAAPYPTVHATTHFISCHCTCQTERPDEANHRPSEGDRKPQPCSRDPGARGTKH